MVRGQDGINDVLSDGVKRQLGKCHPNINNQFDNHDDEFNDSYKQRRRWINDKLVTTVKYHKIMKI